MRLLFLSTSVGPLGSGLGGGVELTLRNIAKELARRGHQIEIVAPIGSELPHPQPAAPPQLKTEQSQLINQSINQPTDQPIDQPINIVQIPGNWQIMAQSQGRDALITLPADAVLGQMWDYARQVQTNYDLLLNFAYDWLPFYLTPFFNRPIAHLVSMGSLTDAMDQVIEQTLDRFPETIGVHSRAQAATFRFGDRCHCLANGFDLSQYEFQPEPEDYLGWVGRIAPEKGLEDAIAASQKSGVPLKIWGAISDHRYWQRITHEFVDADFHYAGFVSTQELQAQLRHCRALLTTPKWVEAFGNVAVEALACGVPVIAYDRGGPAEIVESGKSGWLVEPDSIAGLISAIERLDQIDRHNCRLRAESEYSMTVMGDRVEAWFEAILSVSHSPKHQPS